MAAAFRQTMMRALLRGGKASAAAAAPSPPPRPSPFSTSSGTSQGHRRPRTDHHQSDDLQRHHDQLRAQARGIWEEERKRAAIWFRCLQSILGVAIFSGAGYGLYYGI